MSVSGTGSVLARVMFVFDGPTEEDSKRGRLLTGKGGDEFRCWLDRLCRLTTEDVYITSFMRSYEKKDRPFTAGEIDDVDAEIIGVNPEIIVPIGTAAIEQFLGAWASWELCHGLPHRVDDRTVFPMTHPGAPQYELMVWDFEQLAGLLAGRVPIHTVDTAPVDYQEAPSVDDAESWEVVAIDTEGSAACPWCLTYSAADRRAGLIRTADRYVLDRFADALHQSPNLTIAMHYAPHDLRVLDAMGVHIDCARVRVIDTMQMAYIAGRVPQGLKALSYRLSRMRMRDYMDLVGPAAERIATEYLAAVETLFAPAHPKDKKHPVYKAIQRCKKSKRGARALWVDQQPEILQAATERAGVMREATLDDVPFADVLTYACSDADATRRAYFKLREYFD